MSNLALAKHLSVSGALGGGSGSWLWLSLTLPLVRKGRGVGKALLPEMGGGPSYTDRTFFCQLHGTLPERSCGGGRGRLSSLLYHLHPREQFTSTFPGGSKHFWDLRW